MHNVFIYKERNTFLKITIISGSHRTSSESGRVGRFLENEIQKQFQAETLVIDLGKDPLPLWNDGFWRKEDPWTSAWQPISETLMTSDGFIFIAPEWNGSAPAALKNFFHYANTAEMAHKPGLIVGVSSSIGGTYPIAELRMSSYKNCKICFIPDHLVVRHASKIFKDDVEDNFKGDDDYMQERVTYTLNVFHEYAKALQAVRASGVTETEKFGFGM